MLDVSRPYEAYIDHRLRADHLAHDVLSRGPSAHVADVVFVGRHVDPAVQPS
jgi:hypothetical protein